MQRVHAEALHSAQKTDELQQQNDDLRDTVEGLQDELRKSSPVRKLPFASPLRKVAPGHLRPKSDPRLANRLMPLPRKGARTSPRQQRRRQTVATLPDAPGSRGADAVTDDIMRTFSDDAPPERGRTPSPLRMRPTLKPLLERSSTKPTPATVPGSVPRSVFRSTPGPFPNRPRVFRSTPPPPKFPTPPLHGKWNSGGETASAYTTPKRGVRGNSGGTNGSRSSAASSSADDEQTPSTTGTRRSVVSSRGTGSPGSSNVLHVKAGSDKILIHQNKQSGDLTLMRRTFRRESPGGTDDQNETRAARDVHVVQTPPTRRPVVSDGAHVFSPAVNTQAPFRSLIDKNRGGEKSPVFSPDKSGGRRTPDPFE